MSDIPKQPDNNYASTISKRKAILASYLADPLSQLAKSVIKFWPDQQALDARFGRAYQQFRELKHCNQLYAMSLDGIQISSLVTQNEINSDGIGSDRSYRPYMVNSVPAQGMMLSPLYVNSTEQLTSITALHLVEDGDKKLGYLAAEFTLLSLPSDDDIDFEDRKIWLQIKGDPSIRSAVFEQSRANSLMDEQIDQVISIATELLTKRGVFHLKFHFSSSRVTLWLYSDPYRYRVHVLEEFLDTPFAYRKKGYPKDAIVKPEQLKQIFSQFKALRDADDMIYLRAGGINIINGMVSLNFSCDGSHYMPAAEFISKGNDFWMDTAGTEQN